VFDRSLRSVGWTTIGHYTRLDLPWPQVLGLLVDAGGLLPPALRKVVSG
jgi:hypothetical protein